MSENERRVERSQDRTTSPVRLNSYLVFYMFNFYCLKLFIEHIHLGGKMQKLFTKDNP